MTTATGRSDRSSGAGGGASRFLLVDDRGSDIQKIDEVLRSHGSIVEVVPTGAAGLQLAREKRFDCVIVAAQLQDMSAVDFVEEMNPRDGSLDSPIVVLADEDSSELATEAMTSGASDYVRRKFLDDYIFPRTVFSAIERFQLLAERRRHNARNAQLAAIIGSSEDAIVSVDAERRIQTWNPGAERLFGFSEAEVLGLRTDEFLVSAGYSTQPAQMFKRATTTKSSKRYETVRNHKSGLPIDVEITNSPILDANGEMIGASIIYRDIRPAKAAERALRESEQRFRAMFDAIATYAGLLRPDGSIIAINRAGLEAAGVEREEEVVGRKFWEVAAKSGHARKQFQEIIARGAKGEFSKVERSFRLKSGEERWVTFSVTPVTGGDGEVLFLVPEGHDITDIKKAEIELARLAAIVESSADAIVGKTPDGIVTSWNESAEEIFGYKAAEMIGQSIRLIVPDSLETEEDMVLASVATGKPVYIETVRLRRDGTPVDVSLGASPIYDSAERVIGASTFIRDITARKRAEEQVREFENRFRIMADKLPLLVWMLGNEGIEFVNTTYCEYFGIAREAAQGSHWQRLVHKEDAARVANQLSQCIAQRTDFHEELRVRNADGQWRWLESWAQPYFSASGIYQGHIGASADVTERKENDTQIRLLMREVNHRSKNLLAVLQSIVRQTARDASPVSFAKEFAERLQSLSASQDLMIAGNWVAVRLSDLVESQLGYLGSTLVARCTLSGPVIRLTPAAAQGIGMAIHELATNAVKYGAFSTDSGHIAITWDSDESDTGDFHMSWVESGGPPVSEPARKGFGRTVIERMAAHTVGGEVKLSYHPAGLVWELKAPAGNVLYKGY
ncbi:MAG: PAS domain S-box protein [Beijerinckiaceae bacterium]